MVFRRRFRKFGRRRRPRPETFTIVQCHNCKNVYGDSPCSSPLTDVMEIMTMRTRRDPADTTEISNPSDRFVVVDGIKFQSEHSHDPSETQGFGVCDPQAQNLAFLLTIWEAIVVLPFAQGSAVPAYLPNFTNANFQTGDTADRVLWKRISQIPIWGTALSAGFPQISGTLRDIGHGPVAVKAKVRLDDRHGLYYVRNFTHNVFGLGTMDFNSCTADLQTNPCVVPVVNDAWWKVFYHTRK